MIRHQIARILSAIADRIEPRQSTELDVTLDRISEILSGHIVGYGVAGRAFKPGDGTDYAY